MGIYSYKLEGGTRGRRQGDQRPQPLHRDEGPGGQGLHRVQVDPVRRRRPRPPDSPAAVLGKLAHAVDCFVLYLYFGRSPSGRSLQALVVRAQPRADGGGQDRSLHAPALRLQAARQLRRLFVPGLGSYALGLAVLALALAVFFAWRDGQRGLSAAQHAAA